MLGPHKLFCLTLASIVLVVLAAMDILGYAEALKPADGEAGKGGTDAKRQKSLHDPCTLCSLDVVCNSALEEVRFEGMLRPHSRPFYIFGGPVSSPRLSTMMFCRRVVFCCCGLSLWFRRCGLTATKASKTKQQDARCLEKS